MEFLYADSNKATLLLYLTFNEDLLIAGGCSGGSILTQDLEVRNILYQDILICDKDTQTRS